MQQIFKSIFFFPEPTVLRRRLQPLCAGHVMLLMSADSPFVESSVELNISHLAFAVGICSRTFKDAEAWLKSPGLLDDVKTWGASCGDLDYTSEMKVFVEYLSSMSAFPARWRKSKNPQPCQHPWPLLLVTSIMPLVGEDRAWSMPLPQAISYWSALQEIQGDRMLKLDWELAAIEQMKQKRESNEK